MMQETRLLQRKPFLMSVVTNFLFFQLHYQIWCLCVSGIVNEFSGRGVYVCVCLCINFWLTNLVEIFSMFHTRNTQPTLCCLLMAFYSLSSAKWVNLCKVAVVKNKNQKTGLMTRTFLRIQCFFRQIFWSAHSPIQLLLANVICKCLSKSCLTARYRLLLQDSSRSPGKIVICQVATLISNARRKKDVN